jgi:hypothetical protein
VPDGAVVQSATQTGVIEMLDKTQLASIKKPAKSFLDILRFVQSNTTDAFEEHQYELRKEDLANS